MLKSQTINKPVNWLTNTEQLYTYAAATMLFCFIGWFWGFRYEEFTDVYWNTLLSGILTGEPTGFFTNYLNHTFTSWGIARLYAWLPDVPWYGGMLVFALWISTALLLQIIWLLKRQSLFWLLLIPLFPLWLQNITSIQFTRAAYFTALFPLLLFMVRQTVSTEPARYKFMWVLLNTILIWSALTRLETITLILFQVFLYYLLCGWFKKQLSALLFFFIPALLVLSALWTLINFDFNEADAAYRKVRSYTNTLWDFGQASGSVVCQNERDSVALQTAQQFFLNDPSVINEAFFKKTGVLPKEKMPGSVRSYLSDLGTSRDKAIIFLNIIWYKQPGLSFLNLVILLSGLFLLRKNFFKNYLAIHIAIWLMLFGLAVFMKMEDRVFEPVIFTLLIFSAVFVLLNGKQPDKKATVFLVFLSLTLTGLYTYLAMQSISLKSNQYAQLQTYAKSVQNETALLFPNEMLVYNLWAYNLFYQGPLNRPKQTSNFCFSVDNGLLFLLPAYKNQTQKLFGTSALKPIIKQLKDNNQSVVFISDESRMVLLKKYMRAIYSIDINYRIVQDKATINNGGVFLNWQTPFVFHYYKLSFD